jgi:hypothetical protein
MSSSNDAHYQSGACVMTRHHNGDARVFPARHSHTNFAGRPRGVAVWPVSVGAVLAVGMGMASRSAARLPLLHDDCWPLRDAVFVLNAAKA